MKEKTLEQKLDEYLKTHSYHLCGGWQKK